MKTTKTTNTEPTCIHKIPTFNSPADAMREASKWNYANETGPRVTPHLCGDGKWRLAEFENSASVPRHSAE